MASIHPFRYRAAPALLDNYIISGTEVLGVPTLAACRRGCADGGDAGSRSSSAISACRRAGPVLGVDADLAVIGTGRERHGATLREVATLADAGKLRPLVDETRFTLSTAADPHRHLESGEATGKVVIDITEAAR